MRIEEAIVNFITGAVVVVDDNPLEQARYDLVQKESSIDGGLMRIAIVSRKAEFVHGMLLVPCEMRRV